MEFMNSEKSSSSSKSLYESMLSNAILMTEMALEIKERAQMGEKYICHLRSLAVQGSRAISAMNNSAKQFVLLSQKLASCTLRHLAVAEMNEPEMHCLRLEYERLVGILDREVMDYEDLENLETNNETHNHFTNSERLRNLETKQRFCEQTINLPQSMSSRSLRSEFDEKYPENWSKESLIDLGNIVNLPPVPEDVFTSFAKPVRTSSLSSLKSIRKVRKNPAIFRPELPGRKICERKPIFNIFLVNYFGKIGKIYRKKNDLEYLLIR